MFFIEAQLMWASQVDQWVKNPPTVQETRVQSLGWEDSSGEFHVQRRLASYNPWGCKELDVTEVTWHTLISPLLPFLLNMYFLMCHLNFSSMTF